MQAQIIIILTLVSCEIHGGIHQHLCRVQFNGITEGKPFRYKDHRNDVYCSYLGIPYAEPPIGPLRFQSPKPISNPKTGFVQARTLGDKCFQESLIYSYAGSEDCLYLNIFTPETVNSANNTKYPVMFWIHGGAFNQGSGSYNFFGPDYLIREGIILVTINYRLGVFGFLSAPEWDIHGNMGLKDQRLALKWVYDNIEKFGGDKDKITIAGESAGAASVHFLMMDNSTRKYYQRAILQSGTLLNPTANQIQPLHHNYADRFIQMRIHMYQESNLEEHQASY
ncbi:venom carboxylesterase-6-like [Ctenocephalides felis]|uniref:venom carboxylesterase-6-like n=1 Tax=Ctenocephalides felis TaxID=7515 RepID=UPI000E6E5256|nr:venom carboxylesterase-6-like [Ctenocephalides felis]